MHIAPNEAPNLQGHALDQRVLREKWVWDEHIHLGDYPRLDELNVGIPFLEPADNTMVERWVKAFDILRSVDLSVMNWSQWGTFGTTGRNYGYGVPGQGNRVELP